MLPNLGKGRSSLRGDAGPVVMKKQGGSVVDEIELPMPVEQVRVARSTVHVLHEGVEPNPKRGGLRGCSIFCGGIEHGRARQVIQTDIQAVRRLEKAANFVIGLIAAK